MGSSLIMKAKPFCEPCVYGKQHRRQHNNVMEQATKPLARVHIDFWGPYRLTDGQKKSYLLTFTDDYSRKIWVYPTRARSNAWNIFHRWQQQVEAESKEKVIA